MREDISGYNMLTVYFNDLVHSGHIQANTTRSLL